MNTIFGEHTTAGQLLHRASEYGVPLEHLHPDIGSENPISSYRVQKPGLALTGFLFHVHPDRVQIFGATEIAFLETLPTERQSETLEAFCALRPAMIIVTCGGQPPLPLVTAAEHYSVALCTTTLKSSECIEKISGFIGDLTAGCTSLHGVMVDVFGVGILITGESGVGKSEAALDLVLRGHRLVADDMVDIQMRPPDILIATSPDLTRHHMEVRGLGIINIKDLYGISVVRKRKKLEFVVELVHWQKVGKIDRLGIDRKSTPILGVEIPRIELPVTPGRNISGIIEVAARDYLLRLEGVDSAANFQQRLVEEIRRSSLLHTERNEVE